MKAWLAGAGGIRRQTKHCSGKIVIDKIVQIGSTCMASAWRHQRGINDARAVMSIVWIDNGENAA